MAMNINKEGFKLRARRRYDQVELPDGESVRIQSLTELERSTFETETLMPGPDGHLAPAKSKLINAKQRLIALDVDHHILLGDIHNGGCLSQPIGP